MSYNYSTYTQCGIKSERYLYTGWLLLVVLCSFAGDTTILVASIKYNAIHLQNTVVVFIQHIAACDLLNSAFSLFPSVLSAMFNSDGSSRAPILFQFFISYLCTSAGASLVSAMTLGKLLALKYPLRARCWSKRKAHKVCAVIWFTLLTVPIVHLLIDPGDVAFDYRVYNSSYRYSARIWKLLSPTIAILVLFAPTIVIIVSTILLLKEARKVVRGTQESLRWQGITTVVLTATLLTVNCLPMTVYLIAQPLVYNKELVTGPFSGVFYRIAAQIININVLSNFFLYSLTSDCV